MAKPFTLCGVQIHPGETREVELVVSELYTTSPVAIPIRVVRGWEPGPRLFVTAAIRVARKTRVSESVRRARKLRLVDCAGRAKSPANTTSGRSRIRTWDLFLIREAL